MVTSFMSDMRLYRRLIGMQIHAQMQYKTDLIVGIITLCFLTGLEFVALLLYFVPFHTLLGWQIGEVALLVSLSSFGSGLAEMVGAGVDHFADTIRRGDFDRLLIRPVGTFLLVMGNDFRLNRLGRLLQASVAFGVATYLLPNLHWSFDRILVLVLGIMSNMIIFISILLLGATLCFWTVETTELTNLLHDGGREMLNYPITIYNQSLQRFFLFVVPIAFGSYVPACYILGRSLPFGLPMWLAFLSPCAALLFAFVAGLLWRFGVRHYQSTGS